MNRVKQKNKCRHPNDAIARRVWRVGGGDIKRWFDCASFETPDSAVCWKCGYWFPLGSAKDDGEHAERVAIELRAAGIAMSEAGLFGFRGMSVGEWYGWEAKTPKELGDYRASGYLARRIVEHSS